MATVTPNFNWPVPTSTDLVKDGATAIEALGDSIDASLVDLKGGTTGQVLSKTSNTDMDFTWVAADDTNAIQNSIVDAKGDLIAASANDTPARLAVGNNGETLVADSSTSTGLRYQAPVQQNPFLNSAAQVWQRGTSISYTNGQRQFSADRWEASSTNGSGTVSRQATGDTTNLPNVQYAIRFQRTAGQTATGGNFLAQNFESINSIPFSGKTVTVSYYARAGANFSGTFSPWFGYGTGTDQNVYTGLTGQTTLNNTAVTLTTTWQRFSFTVAVPATSTQLAFYWVHAATGTAGAADYFEVTGVQLEVGSVATPFKTYAGTIQGELAACQRYYYRYDPNASGTSASFSRFGFGSANSTSVARVQLTNPVAMRIGAATLDYGSQITLFDGVTANAVSTLAIDTSTPLATTLVFTATSAGLTQYRPYWLYANSSTTAVVGLSAEL